MSLDAAARAMVRGPLGTCAQGPDGPLWGFFDEEDLEDELGYEQQRRVVHRMQFEVVTSELGSVAQGTVLRLKGRELKVWDRPKQKDDGTTSMLYLVEVA